MNQTQRSRLESLKHAIHVHLETGIIPFWRERAWDQVYGGFLTNFDEQGRVQETSEKYLNTQARLTWWFSHLYRKEPHIEKYRALAVGGVDFLIEHFWDKEHGGWIWKTLRDGSRLDDGKITYGQSFAIYALAEYAMATSDRRGLTYASQTFDLLQKYGADTLHGGYYENLEPDWTVAPAGFYGGDRKSLDTHMHLMESLTTLYEASGEAIHRRKLMEVVNLISMRMIDPESGCGLNQFDLAWKSVPAIALHRTWNAERAGDAPPKPAETTSYGHNVELEWLMTRAFEVAGEEIAPRRQMLRRLLEHAYAHGIDWQCGGIYRDGLRNGGALVLEKEFWQHAEALVGFLDGYERFGDARFLDAFEQIWQFVAAHMIVPSVGEWRILLDRAGNPIDTNTGNDWKVSYHTGRAMMECKERLERLLS